MCGYFEQFAQIGHSPRRNHIELPLSAFNFGSDNRRIQIERFHHPVEKLSAEAAGLDQRHRARNEARHDDSRQAGPRADVRPRCPGTRLKPYQLRRIKYVAIPQVVERRSRNEILTRVLLSKKRRKSPELLECFT